MFDVRTLLYLFILMELLVSQSDVARLSGQVIIYYIIWVSVIVSSLSCPVVK